MCELKVKKISGQLSLHQTQREISHDYIVLIFSAEIRRISWCTFTCHNKPYLSHETWSHFVSCCSNTDEWMMQNAAMKTSEAFILFLHFCVACSRVLIREKRRSTSLFPSEGSVCVLSCTLEQLFTSVCSALCSSDPSVAPSPTSSFSTPYQKRERTLNARMYYPRQFSFHSPFLLFHALQNSLTATDWWSKDTENKYFVFSNTRTRTQSVVQIFSQFIQMLQLWSDPELKK